MRGARRLLSFLPGAALGLVALALLIALVAPQPRWRTARAAPAAGKPAPLDPSAWGADHVGKPVPTYMESGECLFCHRDQVGGSWQTNKHNRTIRDADPAESAMQALAADPKTKQLAAEVELLMGDTHAQRFLKRSAEYGHAELLTAHATFGRGRRARIQGGEGAHWDTESFATKCAGCHTTAVNPETHAFSTVALDCFSCHGEAPDEHTEDAKQIIMAKERKDSAAVVTSICGSCHVRFGKSKATGLPYPTNFVAGDNLFKDFQVDWSAVDDPQLNPADAHVMDNVRDVVLHGQESMTCLSCHEVHAGTTNAHRKLADTQYCRHCHEAGKPLTEHKTYEVHSERCQY